MSKLDQSKPHGWLEQMARAHFEAENDAIIVNHPGFQRDPWEAQKATFREQRIAAMRPVLKLLLGNELAKREGDA